MTATDELRALLTSDWQPAVEVQRKAEALGLSFDQIRGARETLGVTKATGAVGFRDGHWYWRLPPHGCVTCHRPWGPEGFRGGDYWSDRPSTPASHEEEDDIEPLDEPPAPIRPPTQPARYERSAPPRCDACGRASAMERGSRCPFQSSGGIRCSGTMV